MPNLEPATQHVMSKRDLDILDKLIRDLQQWDDCGYDLKWEIMLTFAIDDDEDNLPADISEAVDLMTGFADSFYAIREILEARRDSAVVSNDAESEEDAWDE